MRLGILVAGAAVFVVGIVIFLATVYTEIAPIITGLGFIIAILGIVVMIVGSLLKKAVIHPAETKKYQGVVPAKACGTSMSEDSIFCANCSIKFGEEKL